MGEKLNNGKQEISKQPNGKLIREQGQPGRKTPMYLAINSPRFQRQQLIREIEELTGRTLLCYICGEHAEIGRDDTLGIVELLCNVHPEMSGYIIVSPTPYFAQTDSAGSFKIDNIPDGKYTVVAWHEGSKPQSKPVEVSGTGKVDLALTQ